MLEGGYRYRLVQRNKGLTTGIRYEYLFAFKSTKSNHAYFAWVEEYEFSVYIIKFHLKSHRHSKNKYRHLTNLNEARPLIKTCINILYEFFKNNKMSSFGFIGAASIDETEDNETKRLRIYRKIIATYFGEEHFEHLIMKERNAYLLLRNTHLANEPLLINKISIAFDSIYDNFYTPFDNPHENEQ